MNDTNRAFNRTVLIVVGLILVSAGAAVIAVFAWTAAQDVWAQATTASQTWLQDAAAASALNGSAASWLAVGILALIVVVIAIALIAMFRVGGGRSHTLVDASGSRSEFGTVRVQSAFASDAMQNALADRADLLSTSVTTHTVRSASVMHVRIIPRQNTSPRRIADDVDRLAENLATLTGEQIPTYISIHSSLRARLAKDERRLA